MNLKPQRQNVFILSTVEGMERDDTHSTPEALIMNHRVYKLEELNDEGIAELFNGCDALPLIQKHEESN